MRVVIFLLAALWQGQVATNLVNVATEYEGFHEMTYPVVPESD